MKRIPPGPQGHFISGNLPEFRENLLGFLTACAREHGGLASFRLGPRRLYLASHPDLIEQLLITDQQTFSRRPYLLTMNRVLFGNSLTVSNGEFWLRQRRLCQAGFHKTRIDAYHSLMTSAAECMVESWADGDVRDIHPELMNLTLRIATRMVFDMDITTDGQIVMSSLNGIMRYLDARLTSLLQLPDWVPTPANLQLRHLIRKLDAMVYELIRQRRATGVDRADLLSMLLRARDEDGSAMTDAQVCDEAQNFLMASVETTAISLCWTWYLLARHPDVEKRLVEEWQAVLGGRPPALEDVPQLSYTRLVITESMRVYPPSYMIGRETEQDCELDGYPIQGGADVWVSQWVMHRDPRWFAKPAEFQPERWANGLANRLPKGVYFPFGLGPRSCIGVSFAMMEMIMLLATIGQRCRLTLEPTDRIVTPWPSFALRPRGGMCMKIHRRSGC